MCTHIHTALKLFGIPGKLPAGAGGRVATGVAGERAQRKRKRHGGENGGDKTGAKGIRQKGEKRRKLESW